MLALLERNTDTPATYSFCLLCVHPTNGAGTSKMAYSSLLCAMKSDALAQHCGCLFSLVNSTSLAGKVHVLWVIVQGTVQKHQASFWGK